MQRGVTRNAEQVFRLVDEQRRADEDIRLELLGGRPFQLEIERHRASARLAIVEHPALGGRWARRRLQRSNELPVNGGHAEAESDRRAALAGELQEVVAGRAGFDGCRRDAEGDACDHCCEPMQYPLIHTSLRRIEWGDYASTGRFRERPSARVALDRLFVANVRVLGVATGGSQRTPLAQQVPALIERDPDLSKALAVGVRDRAARFTLVQFVLLARQIIDPTSTFASSMTPPGIEMPSGPCALRPR